MPILKSIQTGNFTDSTTWAVVDSGTFQYQTSTAIGGTSPIIEGTNFTVSSNIEISGVMLHIAAKAQFGAGNVVVRFHNVTTATDLKTVTVNVSDLPYNETGNSFGRNVGWVFFKFDSPITLSTTQTYRLRLSNSAGTAVIAYYGTSTNNFDRALVTTTNAAPISGDTIFVVGEHISTGVTTNYTVTMNNTSSTPGFGLTFVDGGTLRWADTPGSTFHYRITNNLFIRGNGQLIIGDNSAPIPSNTSCRLEFTCTSPSQFGATLGAQGRLITNGSNLSVYKTEINGNIISGATSFVTSVPTNWSNGNVLIIASTTRAANQTEIFTVSSVTGTTVNISGMFQFPHLGTGDIVADVGNLTRNVKIFSTSVTNNSTGFVIGSNTSSISFNNTELYDMGTGNSSYIVGGSGNGTLTISGSSLYSTTNRNWTAINYSNSIVKIEGIVNNIFYNSSNRAINSTMNTNLNIPLNISNNLFLNTGGISLALNGYFNDNTFCSRNTGNAINTPNLFSAELHNLKIYGMGNGIEFNTGTGVNSSAVPNGFSINNARIFRNNGPAILFQTTNNVSTQIPITFNNGRFFGNAISVIQVQGFTNINMIFKDCSFWGGTTEVTPTLITRNTNVYNQTLNRLFFDNCRFGTDYTGNTSNFSSAIIQLNGNQNTFFNNCLFSGTESSTPGFPMERFVGYVSVNHNQIPGAMRTFKSSCVTLKDTTIIDDLPSSIRLIPQSTSFNSISDIYSVPVKSGQTITVSVRVRKSAAPDTAYNGTQPQLIYLINPATGNYFNTPVATGTTSNGIWETLSYTTPIINVDTVLEFYILCNASAGFINISNFRTNTFNNSKSNEYWGFNGSYVEPYFKRPGIQISSVF